MMKTYPAYKDSGLSWLGQVPAHWEVKRAKYVLGEINSKAEAKDRPLLSVSQYTGVTLANAEEQRAETLDGYKQCDVDDLVVNIMLAWNGSLGVSPYNGLVSPAYCVYRAAKTVNPLYLGRLLKTSRYLAEIYRNSRGVVESRMRLYTDDLFRIPTLLPPRDEQDAIVAFLEGKQREMDAFIANKQRTIALMQEQKAALIHRAVTRGLDPDAPLKPSGLDWLGEVPAHWEMRRVKDELEFLNYRRIPLSSPERGAMTQREYDYYGASGVIDKIDKHIFEETTLLIAEDGANLVLRNLPLAIIATGKYWVNNHAHILKPKNGNFVYFASLLETMRYDPYISGSTQPKLTAARLASIPIPVPPDEEQCRIVEHIKAEENQTRMAADQARREIALMQEYRAVLIAEAVTGRIDVRSGSEASLPAFGA